MDDQILVNNRNSQQNNMKVDGGQPQEVNVNVNNSNLDA